MARHRNPAVGGRASVRAAVALGALVVLAGCRSRPGRPRKTVTKEAPPAAEVEEAPPAAEAVPEEPGKITEPPTEKVVEEVAEKVTGEAAEEPAAAEPPAPEPPAPEPEEKEPPAPSRKPRWLVLISSSGAAKLSRAGKEVANLVPGLFGDGWQHRAVGVTKAPPGDLAVCRGTITALDGTKVESVLRWSSIPNGARLAYTLTPGAPTKLNSLHVSMDFPMVLVAGGAYVVDGERGRIPEEFGEVHLLNKTMSSLELELADGEKLSLRFESPALVLLQDNRRWGPSFTARMGAQPGGAEWPAGRPMNVTFDLVVEGGIEVDRDLPVTITAGPDWIPLDVELDIEPGSALDFSKMGFTDPPAGRHGHVIARKDGTFAFEKDPGTPRRFYGVNLCFSAHYITHEQSDRLAERLAALGYNTVRFHHYEGELVSPSSGQDLVASGAPPTATGELTALEAPASEGDRYSARIRGFVRPPATGEYTFCIASDDNSELWLSTDANAAGKVRIASVRGWTGQRQWDKYETQKSGPVRLEADGKYYIEVLHDEGAGGDHVSVAWQGPGVEFGVVQGEHLSPFPSGPRGKIVREVWRTAERTGSVTPNPLKLDQLDYLLAALKKRGIYVTTDIYVSRPVFASEIWPGAEGNVDMNDYKMAVPVNERAFENWKAFARNLLGHVNPYTGLTWAKDPALAWLCMINEGDYSWYIGRLGERVRPDWKKAWNRWLAKTYRTRDALQKAWGEDPGGDPRSGAVALHTNCWEDKPKGRDLTAFMADVDREMVSRMKRFLREELGTKALLTNNNGGPNQLAYQAARFRYDYVDNHFYVDHPQFLENAWQLPSRCPNASPIAEGAAGGRHCSFSRLLDKPFTISEYNYSGPGRFRGVGGILTGSMAALQGWGVIWRFAYSHTRGNLFQPGSAGYFDVASDPLNQAAERASICLYLRGDMKPATHTVGVVMTEDELLKVRKRNVTASPGWHAVALVTRLGTFVSKRPGRVPADIVVPLAWETKGTSYVPLRGGEVLDADPHAFETGGAVLAAMRRRGWLEGNATDLGKSVTESETGQLLIDAPRDVMVLDTPMTAGGYAPEGETVETAAATIRITKTDATVWVSSVDGKPISESRRLIITHLTDLQNTGARFAERARQTLLAWGALPHLVRAGSAEIALRLEEAGAAKVYALATSGRRLGEVKAEVRDGGLVVPLDVKGPDGARMIYEVVVE